jgi:type IV pilus assembly protein PilO
MGFLAKLELIPPQYRWGMIPALLLLVAVAYGYGLYKPEGERIHSLAEQLQRQKLTLQKYRKVAANYDAFQTQVEALEIDLRQALAQLPDSKEVPDLIRQISDLGVRTGLQITLLRPQSEQVREYYAEVPITVNMVGSFHAVGQFFDELARLPRIISVSKIKLDGNSKQDATIVDTECLATTYRFLEESEASASVTPDKPQRKKK